MELLKSNRLNISTFTLSVLAHIGFIVWICGMTNNLRRSLANKVGSGDLVEVELFTAKSPSRSREINTPKELSVVTDKMSDVVKVEKVQPEQPKSIESKSSIVDGTEGGKSEQEGGASIVYQESGVDSRAEISFQPRLKYPSEALRQGLEKNVSVNLVIDEMGKVVEARLPKQTGFGFDEVALEAAYRLMFRPALKAGKAVAVMATWICKFRIE